MAQREVDLVQMATVADPQTSGVWPIPWNDQGEAMAYAVHDAKNMLGALQANVHWLRSNFESSPAAREEIAQAIEDMNICCQRLAMLLYQALQARGQRLEVSPSRVHAGALVAHAVHQVRKQAEARGVRVHPTVRADVVAVMDGLLVSRVLDNLLNNAVSYAPDGSSVIIEYGTDGNDVFFRVSDEGPGIASSVTERLFEPFVTETRPTLADANIHVGLGLAFCKSVARAHGGDITYTNRDSGGAAFTVMIPWVKPSHLSMVPR